jgi:hypothetical protein
MECNRLVMAAYDAVLSHPLRSASSAPTSTQSYILRDILTDAMTLRDGLDVCAAKAILPYVSSEGFTAQGID